MDVPGTMAYESSITAVRTYLKELDEHGLVKQTESGHYTMDEGWMDRMAEEDRRALTPLIHNHVTPYGSFELDMEKRLPLEVLEQILLGAAA